MKPIHYHFQEVTDNKNEESAERPDSFLSLRDGTFKEINNRMYMEIYMVRFSKVT